METPTIRPFLFEWDNRKVSLIPPTHLTVIGSEMVKGGGTTKTTNAMMCGFALVRHGYRVRVVSYDKEHSSLSWADKAYSGMSAFQVGKPLPWPEGLEVENADSPEDLIELVHGYDGDYVIIDGGPADEDSVQVVAALCHYVILPMEPGSLTLEQATSTVNLVREVESEQGRLIDLRILLVRVNEITRVARITKEILAGSDIDVMSVVINEATSVKEAAHAVPRRLFNWPKVIVELLGDQVITNAPNGKDKP